MINQPKQILIVDDDSSLRSLLKLVIEEEGYEVIEAQNGEDCLRKVTQKMPDLILLDAIMPNMDGFDCCQSLRTSLVSPELPILMITFLEDKESIEKAFNVGATDYITKPIHWAVLLKRVERLILSSQAIKQVNNINKSQQDFYELQKWQSLMEQILELISQSPSNENQWKTLLKLIQDYFQVEQVIYLFSTQHSIHTKSTIEHPKPPSLSNINQFPFDLSEKESFIIIDSDNSSPIEQDISAFLNILNLKQYHFLLSLNNNLSDSCLIFCFKEQKLWTQKMKTQIKQLMIFLTYLSLL